MAKTYFLYLGCGLNYLNSAPCLHISGQILLSWYKFENFEEYFGGAEEVRKIMDECKVCGAKLLLSHMPDYKNLLVQETARCVDCGCGNRRVIHVLN